MPVKTLANRVKERRLELGLTQEELSRRTQRGGQRGLTSNAIRLIEQGKTQQPQGQSLKALAAALEVPVSRVEGWVAGVNGPTPAAGIDELRRIVDDAVDRRLGAEPRGPVNEFAEAIRGIDNATIPVLERLMRMFTEALEAERLRRADEA